MNLLAHFHLSEPAPKALLGSFLGDFVKGDPADRYDAEICRAIAVHRKIDAFTDRHPAWRNSKARLSGRRRRFAGIIVDIFYDHFLSLHWRDFGVDASLPQAIDSYYRSLSKVENLIGNTRASRVLTRMVEEDWLGSYATTEGIAAVLDRVARRSSRVGPIEGAIGELHANAAGMEADFLRFYPDLVAFVLELRRMPSLPARSERV